MTRSAADTVDTKCPNCNTPQSLEIWLIVDTEERPDLAEPIHRGLIHKFTCGDCNHILNISAPLLLHIPNREQVLFIPPKDADKDQEKQMAHMLVQRLAATFGEDVPDYLWRVRPVSLEDLKIEPLPDREEMAEYADKAMAQILQFLPSQMREELKTVIDKAKSPQELKEALDSRPDLRAAMSRSSKIH